MWFEIKVIKMCNKLKYLAFGANYWCRRYIFRQKMPFIAGLVLNQSCNMHCEGCHVSRIDKIYDPTRSDVEVAILELKKMGVRNLAITGGEPFLWESDGWNVSHVIRFARDNGFLAVTVYTNGTLPFDDCNADTVFVSPHGMEMPDASCNITAFQQCLHNIDVTEHKNVILNFTVNSRNYNSLRDVCEFAKKHHHIKGLFFYFHTPYYGRDSLFQPFGKKQEIVTEILSLKQEGFPIFNSTAALKSFASDNWKRPSDLCIVWDKGRFYNCCRSNGYEDACRNCGYLGYLELEQILALKPSAIREGLRYILP